MSAELPVAWITHPLCARHLIEEGHPESPERLAAIEDRLLIGGLGGFMQRHEAPEASREQLLRAHTAAHVDHVLAHRRIGPRRVDIDGETAYTQYTVDAALRAAGAGVDAVERALRGEAGLGFCAVRPPGHHAERARAMGFCFFNNVAVAAAHALACGLERVAVVDFDVHYGNGTADIFRDDPRVLLLSSYQHPLYPCWTGAPEAANLVDVPLPAYTRSDAFRAAVTAAWLPALEAQRPQMIFVSAGFDAHAADPLADLRLSYDDYRWLGALIRDIAADTAQQRVVATLEGGYDLTALARSVEAFLSPFLGAELLPA
ncbi:MAG: histone deacetylase family protein [Sinimarinibacterium flocculans]|uniref:Acetoin utilization deacetylase AcuC-like enzyme n=1 Tax=Sinimarinibacterium flocculans TaxID=985250 RepID=A0A318EI00_9GAMM|nr:histone deacetylase family protein [Sinimarinibacterium flocculans]PXV70218.1 acetoin utilization deacetylase AcuC-like enzyme [Sinimarinibacterium flocculans]